MHFESVLGSLSIVQSFEHCYGTFEPSDAGTTHAYRSNIFCFLSDFATTSQQPDKDRIFHDLSTYEYIQDLLSNKMNAICCNVDCDLDEADRAQAGPHR